MNRKRRHLAYPGMGYPGGGYKGSIFTRKPKPIFEEIKLVYGAYISAGNEYLDDTHLQRNSFKYDIHTLILNEKKRQLMSYVTHGILVLIAFVLLIFIMNITG